MEGDIKSWWCNKTKKKLEKGEIVVYCGDFCTGFVLIENGLKLK